jgi:hypothetical protein
MLLPVSMYARCPSCAALALVWLLGAVGCEGPDAATPGLEPPKPRDGGSTDGEGTGGKQPGNMPPPGRADAGPPPAMSPGGAGGMSGSVGGSTAPGQMPGMMEPAPTDEDAGSEL